MTLSSVPLGHLLPFMDIVVLLTICLDLNPSFRFRGGGVSLYKLRDLQVPILLLECCDYRCMHPLTQFAIFFRKLGNVFLSQVSELI